MSKKTDWAQVDKRIRHRLVDDAAAVEEALDALPDLADQCEVVDVEQPALVREESEFAGGADSVLN